MAVIIYALYKGIETIARGAQILLFINIIFLLISIIGLIPAIKITNIMPIFENNVSHILHGGIIQSLGTSISVFLLMSIPKNQITNKTKYSKNLIISYILANVVISLFFFLTISVLGINLCLLYKYPLYITLKKISFFNFIERIENIVVIRWIFDSIFLIIMALYFIKKVIKTKTETAKKKKDLYIFMIIGTIILLLSNYSFEFFF